MFKIGKLRVTKKRLKKLKNFFYNLLLAAVVLLAALTALSTLKIPGNFKLLVVQSGSMEPKIKQGAVVIIKPLSKYKKGDVITVFEPANPKITLTHRIVEIEEKDGKVLYATKGDANKGADTEKRPKENVLGKVILTVPYLGYPIGFAKTRTGLIILVIIPAVIIIYNEFLDIRKEIRRLIRQRKQNEKESQEAKN